MIEGMALTTASAAAFAVADAIIVESSGAQPGRGGFCTWQASFSWVDTSLTTLSLILTALSSTSRAQSRVSLPAQAFNINLNLTNFLPPFFVGL